MPIKREEIYDLSPLSIKKINDNTRTIWEKVFGNINFADLGYEVKDGINSKVSDTDFSSYKTQTANEISSKVSSTTLANYSTTSQTATNITSAVNGIDYASKIEQNADSVKVAVGQIGGNNLFKDGSFELGYAISQLIMVGFQNHNIVSNGYNSDVPVEGNNLIQFLDNSNSGLYHYVDWKGIKVKPNTKYTLSFWQNVGSYASIQPYNQLVFWDSNNAEISEPFFNGSVGTIGLQKYIHKFTTPSNCANMWLRFGMLVSAVSAVNWMDLDAIKLEEGENATAWSPNANELKGANYEFSIDGFKLTNGTNTVMISPDGMLNSDTVFANDNVDSSHPLKVQFYIPDETITVKSVKVQIAPQAFRAYSTGASSGGGSTSGASSITTSGASSRNTSDAQGWTTTSDYWANVETGYGGTQGVTILKSAFAHTHGLSHNHNMAHNHGIEHNHEIAGHMHDLLFGIYESTTPTSMDIKTDGTTRFSGLSGNQNKDVSSFITTSGWHTIEVTSNQLGRIACSVYIETFTSR